MMQESPEPKQATHLTRNPSKCPIIRCPTVLSETALLDHLLSEHKSIDLKTIEAGEKAVLTFRESVLPYGEPICMGLVLYGGTDEHCRPTQMGLSQRNSILSSRSLVFENYFPVLVMGCKTHVTDMLADDEIPAELYNDICERREALPDGLDSSNDIFVFWLIGPSATRPIHGDLTIYDSEWINVRGCRMQVRDFKDFLHPKSFLSKGLDYLMVNRGGMNLLAPNGDEELEMEVFVKEGVEKI